MIQKKIKLSSSKTIAKNSLFLYFRMFLTMGIGLYTSRVVLNTLGIEDFGIYNIVGGIVILFGFFNSAMSSATQRFLSFDIGKGDVAQVNKTFNATLNIHFLIAIIVFLLAETIGLWFVNYKLNLPSERMNAVNWVYQFSILTFIFGIIQVPYNALIIAKERMNFYAYVSIFETIAKLLIVYLLVILDFDKLIIYAFLLFIVALCVRLIEKEYCKNNFEESKYFFYYNKDFYKTLLSFSGWSLFGNIAAVARSQGNNILLNLFFGTLLNAAYGIAIQVQGVVSSFVSNFQMAVNPQIIKQFAAGNTDQSLKLIYQSSKFSFFIMFVISSPIIFNVEYVLQIWLKETPTYTAIFVILSLINILIDSISGPLMVAAQAQGNIKWYQISIGTLIFCCLPFSYVMLKIQNNPAVVFGIIIIVNLLTLYLRTQFLRRMIAFKVLDFCKNVLLKIIIFVVISLISSFLLIYFIRIESQAMLFMVRTFWLFISNIIIICFVGMNREERNFILSYIRK